MSDEDLIAEGIQEGIKNNKLPDTFMLGFEGTLRLLHKLEKTQSDKATVIVAFLAGYYAATLDEK